MDGAIIFNKKQEDRKTTDQSVNLPQQNARGKSTKFSDAKDNEEGHREFIKEHAKEDEKSEKKLDDLVASSNKVLLKLSTAAPLNPFPTDLIISLDKISLIVREFFMNATIHTWPIGDVKEAVVRTGVLWSSLEIVIESYHEGPVLITYLKTQDAIRARRIIQGLEICKEEGVILAKLKEEDILAKVEEIGKARE